jgi:hypothetical protein
MAGNSHEGHKKVTLCSESELELTIDQLIKDVQTRCGLGEGHGQIPFLAIWRLQISKIFSIFLITSTVHVTVSNTVILISSYFTYLIVILLI